jgi:hypothetical protein
VYSRNKSNKAAFEGASTYLERRDQFSSHYEKAQRRQRALWDLYIAKNGWGIEMIKTHDLAPLVQGGIPDELRGTALIGYSLRDHGGASRSMPFDLHSSVLL